MKNPLRYIGDTFLSDKLDFRVRLFNVLAMAGVMAGLIMGAINAINGGGIRSVITGIGAASLSFALIYYAYKSGRYQLCYLITIVVIFLGYFPMLFFQMGGYHGGKIAFFIFAIVYTAYMLEGKTVWIVTTFQLFFYTGVFVYAYVHPDSVTRFPSETGYLIDSVSNFLFVSIALSLTLITHLRMYNRQQRKLDEQNDLLTQISRGKTEFLANTSHEMRTPLTVISVNVQKVMAILEDMGETVKDPEAAELLTDAQSEIMRLARMVGGMLTLASISENTEKSKADLGTLLRSAADMLWLLLQKRGNRLETEIDEGLTVFADADLLSQVVVNLIQNAHAHTENDVIRLRAARDGGVITVTVRDNGSGISPNLLPRVFDRGATDGAGTGYGLSLCKMAVESHGGEIWIESEPGKGTTVHFTLPVYEGQYGGDAA